MWPDVPFSCAYGGCLWPGIAQNLASMAPREAAYVISHPSQEGGHLRGLAHAGVCEPGTGMLIAAADPNCSRGKGVEHTRICF
jgi:hypothetical protein